MKDQCCTEHSYTPEDAWMIIKSNVTGRFKFLGPKTENEMVPGVEVGLEKRKEMTPKKETRVNHGKGKGAHPEKEKEVAPGKEKETTTSEKEGEAVQERKVSQKRERGAESLNVLCSITHCCTPFGVYA